MKTVLTFLCTLTSLMLFGQKQLIGVSETLFDQQGNILNLISQEYIYETASGELASLQPDYTIDGTRMTFMFDFDALMLLPCDTIKLNVVTNGSSQTSTNTLENDLVTATLSGGGTSRKLYTYNEQNLLVKSIRESLNGGTWVVADSMVFSYDAVGNQLTSATYSEPSSGLLFTDTSTYLSGTSQLSTYIRYGNNGTGLKPISQSRFTYTDGQLDYNDVYENQFGDGLVWASRVDYSMLDDDLPEEYLLYLVFEGELNTTAISRGFFDYTSTDQIVNLGRITNTGATLYYHNFQYDEDGFMTETTYFFSNNGVVYPLTYTQFTYAPIVSSIKASALISARLFPNPTQDQLTVSTADPIQEVRVFNMAGHLLLRQDSATLDVSHLPAGTYILRGETTSNRFSTLFVKH
ncbi:MAG: T9SS type A sorting domain-containing protein [Bacteroidota bacterium]